MIFSKAILAQEDVIILNENSSKRSSSIGGLQQTVKFGFVICVVFSLRLDLTIYWGVQKIGCTTNLKPLIETHDSDSHLWRIIFCQKRGWLKVVVRMCQIGWVSLMQFFTRKSSGDLVVSRWFGLVTSLWTTTRRKGSMGGFFMHNVTSMRSGEGDNANQRLYRW